MGWADKLKQAGINVHVISTGGGAGIQQELWMTPGSSAYFSGATFPYDQAEQIELLGFTPEHYCSEDAAIDLASAAYMKAFKFGGKKAVGIGVTASVASEKEHRGDHRVFACIMTDDKVHTAALTLKKGVGIIQRIDDGTAADFLALGLLMEEFVNEGHHEYFPLPPEAIVKDAKEKARERFFKHPFFTAGGKRLENTPQGAEKLYALMPGSFNPPHEGHLGIAESFRFSHGKNVLFEIGTNPPHKTPPTVQELLQRAKMLKGHDVIFTKNIPMYVEKAAWWHGMSFIVGADTMLRILNWSPDSMHEMGEIWGYGNDFYVTGREVNNQFVTRDDIVASLPDDVRDKFAAIIHPLEGRWDVSSSELRKKI